MAKRKTLDSDGIWRPKTLKIEFTDEKLTAASGLGPFVDAFVSSPQYEKLRACVPTRSSNASYDPMQFVLPLMAGFWHDYDCLEDMEKFGTKVDMTHRFQNIPSPRAFGDFLRDFEPDHIESLNQFLTKQALAARKLLAPGRAIVLDMDSTSHVQSGKKIEGLGYNYKGELCLESLDSFDELGFSYGFRLRAGGTFSSLGAGPEIDRIFRHLDYSEEKHFRGDSAFCNEEVIRTCLLRGAKFTITAHGNTGWEQKINQVTEWEPWQYSEEEIKQAAKNKKELPEVELGSMLYQPGWAENLRFFVVIKRTRVKESTMNLFMQDQTQDGWRHYAVLTNRDLFRCSKQSIIEHHAKRGNSENFIREQKIHLDLRHFPCQSLMANFGYGLIAMVSYNFMRLIARLDEPEKPHYAKKLREKYLYIPAKVTKHARQFFLKIPKLFRKEVEQMQTGWAGSLEAALAMS